MHISTPLSALRNLLIAQGLDGMIVPRADAHQSEDCTPHDNKLAWLTGFSGSAGLALVLRDRALMFVDGRYQVQVRNEVSLDDFEIHHLHDEPLADYLQSHVAAGTRIGFEPLLMVNSQFEALSATHCELVPLEQDPFDQVWLDRPAAPCDIIREMPIEISGESSTQKRARVVEQLAQHETDVLAITLPDNIAWLLNVRGSDLAMVPVPFSFALLHRSGELEWFVDSNKTQQLPVSLLNTLTLAPQESFLVRCQQLASGKRFLVDKDYAPVALRFAIEEHGGNVLWAPDPITLMKAHKNDVELAGYRECHEQDGAAWVNFLAWLAHEVPLREAAGNPVTELEAQAKQLEFRHSSEKTNTPITSQAMYLNDSGGQYHNGTTDTTRTFAFGPQDPQRRLHYTAVLKGFLSLISLQFPSGTQGHQLDAFSRRALWDLGLDFDHGTGHGVGHQLLIHEQPHRIAKKVNPWPLVAGNIITIEPGYYLAGQYGIRIENQVEIINSRPGFCRFSTLTLVPIDLNLVELHLLSEAEKQWIDDYHQQVRETLSPRVNAEARPWLFAVTAPIRVQAN